jgi:hypothetical protein
VQLLVGLGKLILVKRTAPFVYSYVRTNSPDCTLDTYNFYILSYTPLKKFLIGDFKEGLLLAKRYHKIDMNHPL